MNGLDKKVFEEAIMGKESKIIDLTHVLSGDMPFWDEASGFELILNIDYKDCVPPNLFRTQKIQGTTGVGTHMDAPAHVVPGGRTIDQLVLAELVVGGIIIDVSGQATEDYVIMPEVLEKFEQAHGQIPAGSLVIFYTGWDKRWATPAQYHNGHKFPSVHVSTAEVLVKRNIAGLGIDTLSCDTGKNGFPVHRAVLGADKYLIENIANAGGLPATGAELFALPIKIKDATEAPVRLIAVI